MQRIGMRKPSLFGPSITVISVLALVSFAVGCDAGTEESIGSSAQPLTCSDGGTCEVDADGGAFGPVCGDGTCEGDEDCSTCSGDCAACEFTCTGVQQSGSGAIPTTAGTLSTIPDWSSTTYTNALRACAGLGAGEIAALSDSGASIQDNAELANSADAASLAVSVTGRYSVIAASADLTVAGSIKTSSSIRYARASHAGAEVKRIDDECGTYYIACAYVWSGLALNNHTDTESTFAMGVTGTVNLALSAASANITSSASTNQANIQNAASSFVVRAQGLNWAVTDYGGTATEARDAAYALVIQPVADAMQSTRTNLESLTATLDANVSGDLGWCWSSRHGQCTDYYASLEDADYIVAYDYDYCTYAKSVKWRPYNYNDLAALCDSDEICSRQELVTACQDKELPDFSGISDTGLSNCANSLNANPRPLPPLQWGSGTPAGPFVPLASTHPFPTALSGAQLANHYWQANGQSAPPSGASDYWWGSAGCYECAYTQASTTPNNYCVWASNSL